MGFIGFRRIMMHILLIHQAFASLDQPGGTRHVEMARYLTQKGHQVTVIASQVSYITGKLQPGKKAFIIRQEEDGVIVLRCFAYPALHRSFVHRMVNFFSFMFSSFIAGLSVHHVDLVWGTSPPIFQGFTAWLLSRLKRSKFLFEVRDLWPAFAVGLGVLKQPLLIQASEWLERFLYHQSTRVLINSPGFMTHVQQRGAQQISLIANGADPRMFFPQANGSSYRSAHGLQDKFMAVYAGAHGLSNNLEILLQAAKKLSDRSDIAIVLVGDGKDKPLLQKMAANMGLDNIYFLPSVSKRQMAEVLAAADACIAVLKPIPLFDTVYPNKVFDYMAAGRPVILAISGVIRELVDSVNAGISVPPGDAIALAEAIRHLADHLDECLEMGQRGRKYVEQHFDRAVLADELEKVFLETLG
jgi:glycosyltransferase involved in cell wall biosynthesis